jgi:hypothetical protein
VAALRGLQQANPKGVAALQEIVWYENEKIEPLSNETLNG